MKVLITGASGFIGSQLTQQLLAKGLSVIGLYNNQPMRQQHPRLIAVQKNLSQQGIEAELKQHQPDCLIHAAAINPSVKLDQEQVDFHQFNHQVTMAMVAQFLSFAKSHPSKAKKKLINLSTYEIYGHCDDPAGFDMGASLKPMTAYASSKAKTHQAIEQLESSAVQFINVVCSNNYGPWQSSEKLIPAVVQAFINQQPIELYGDGSSTRTWTHVHDTCEGLVKIAMHGNQRKYHLCSDDDATVEEVVLNIHRLLLSKNAIQTQQPLIKYHPADFNPIFKINNQHSTNDLKWQPSIYLDVGLSTTLDHMLGVKNACKN